MVDQGIDSPQTLASLSDEDIATIYDVIRRPDSLVSGKTPHSGNQASTLAGKESEACSIHDDCSKAYDIRL